MHYRKSKATCIMKQKNPLKRQILWVTNGGSNLQD